MIGIHPSLKIYKTGMTFSPGNLILIYILSWLLPLQCTSVINWFVWRNYYSNCILLRSIIHPNIQPWNKSIFTSFTTKYVLVNVCVVNQKGGTWWDAHVFLTSALRTRHCKAPMSFVRITPFSLKIAKGLLSPPCSLVNRYIVNSHVCWLFFVGCHWNVEC